MGYCIFIDTVFQGIVPTVSDETGKIVVFKTELEAQREIAEHAITRLQQFLDGQRDFEDATAVEEFVIEVEVLPSGELRDNEGKVYERSSE